MHVLAGIDDLYPFGGNMLEYDNMAGAGGTHPSSWTKRATKWLDPAAVAQHVGRTIEYDLHAVSLPQPPPHDRVSGVQIGTTVPYLMVEGRKMADQFDGIIPKEGVIVYRVQTTDPHGHDAEPTPAARAPDTGRRWQPQRARRRRIAHDRHRRHRPRDKCAWRRRLPRADRGSLAASGGSLGAVQDSRRGGDPQRRSSSRDSASTTSTTATPPATCTNCGATRSDARARRISPRTQTHRLGTCRTPWAIPSHTSIPRRTPRSCCIAAWTTTSIASTGRLVLSATTTSPDRWARRKRPAILSDGSPPTTTTTSRTARPTVTCTSCGGPARARWDMATSPCRRQRHPPPAILVCTSTRRAA